MELKAKRFRSEWSAALCRFNVLTLMSGMISFEHPIKTPILGLNVLSTLGYRPLKRLKSRAP
jgi:hypothetical protein